MPSSFVSWGSQQLMHKMTVTPTFSRGCHVVLQPVCQCRRPVAHWTVTHHRTGLICSDKANLTKRQTCSLVDIIHHLDGLICSDKANLIKRQTCNVAWSTVTLHCAGLICNDKANLIKRQTCSLMDGNTPLYWAIWSDKANLIRVQDDGELPLHQCQVIMVFHFQ